MAYRTVAGPAEHREVVKGSIFLARVAPVGDAAAAEAFVAGVAAAHADATHNCPAWRCGREMRASDDGEPGGTAGRPMLEVILKRDLDRVAAVVTRWYGGTRLGAGGLVRAYSGALARALDLAGEREVPDEARRRVRVPYPDVDALFRLLDEWPGLRRSEPAWTTEGVEVEVVLLEADAAALEARVRDLTRGGGDVTPPA